MKMKKYLIYTFAVVWVVALLGAATIGLVQQARGATANETMLRNDVFDLLQKKEKITVKLLPSIVCPDPLVWISFYHLFKNFI